MLSQSAFNFSGVVSATWVLYLLAISQATGLTDKELIAIRDRFDTRRDAYLAEYLEKPLYEMARGIEACRGSLNHAQWIWSPQQDATSNAPIGRCYFRRQLTVSAQRSIKHACIALAADNTCTVTINGQAVGQADGFHRAQLLEITDYLRSGVNVVALAAINLGDGPNPAGILGSVCVNYEDGSTAMQQLAAWRGFLKRYFRERVKRGLLVEISPSGYGSRTLQGWHNIYDFTDDPELKSTVKAALDVWWADWAQEQLGGMRGGGKTRLYPGAWALSHTDRNRAMSWFYLGEGKPAHHHETLPVRA